ncbi:MAG: hypothetical protein QOJ27_1923 [Sphingomonadales bacterium]|nr:hypothetical protein [Sphingomonadales bacterium]
MKGKSRPERFRAANAPPPRKPTHSRQNDLLDEALKETFPASDPTSVYRLD